MVELNRSLLSRALALLGRRRYTKFQLSNRLKENGFEDKDIEDVLKYCEKQGYINDYDFAYFWVEERNKFKPMGRWRLINELKQRGIHPDIIGDVLDELLPPEQEHHLLKGLMEKRLQRGTKGHNDSQRVIRFLLRRGFSYDAIYRVANELNYNFMR